MTYLERLSGIELGKLVNSKRVSPTGVIDYFADRIEEANPRINAFTYTKIEDAMREAKILEERIMKGENCGPFAGVPVGLKDFLPSKKGWQNSHGGVPSLVQIDNADSEFYKAARNLGAIAVGKTNAPPFGFSGTCENTMYGSTRNPFDIRRTSGGSSGGTAAAVASGLITLGEGGDAGGSIRIPSGWCNLFGFKPSLGSVPSYCRPDGWTATHPYCFNGSLTKTVEDSATMLNAMSYYNPRDPISLPISMNKDFTCLMHKSIEEMKIGLTFDFDMYYVDSEIKNIVEIAAKELEDAGARVEFVNFNFKHSLDEIATCWAWAISIDTMIDMKIWSENGFGHRRKLDMLKNHADELTDEFIYFNKMAEESTIYDMRKYNEIRTDILDNFEDVLSEYDVIISPTATCRPMLLDDETVEVDGVELDRMLDFIEFAETFLVNFIGYPAASVPVYFTDDNLPVGMQVIGRRFGDEDVLAVSRTRELIEPWADKYPY